MAQILVVDDLKFIVEMISDVLAMDGHHVDTATNGKDAIRIARETQPDLVLLDILMPEMNGLEVARRLKTDRRTSHIPIMMVSSKKDLETIAEAFGADVSDYVVKPFACEELLEKVGALLGGFRMNVSLSEVEQVPLVTVLHDELEEHTLSEISNALRLAGENRPMVLDLSRVRSMGDDLAEAVDGFSKKVKDLGLDLEVVRPETGVKASGILPGICGQARIHDNRDAAIEAAREAIINDGVTHAVAEPDEAALEAAKKPAGIVGDAKGITFDRFDNMVVVRIRRPTLGDVAIETIVTECHGQAHAVLLEMHQVETVTSSDTRSLAVIAEEMTLSGRAMKIVNPGPGPTTALRDGGLGHLLFWIRD